MNNYQIPKLPLPFDVETKAIMKKCFIPRKCRFLGYEHALITRKIPFPDMTGFHIDFIHN